MRHAKQTIMLGYVEHLQSELEEVVLEYDLQVLVSPGEPMVMYDRNGDGYPGSPPEVEVLRAVCTAVTRECGPAQLSLPMSGALGRALLRRRDDIEDDIYFEALERA